MKTRLKRNIMVIVAGGLLLTSGCVGVQLTESQKFDVIKEVVEDLAKPTYTYDSDIDPIVMDSWDIVDVYKVGYYTLVTLVNPDTTAEIRAGVANVGANSICLSFSYIKFTDKIEVEYFTFNPQTNNYDKSTYLWDERAIRQTREHLLKALGMGGA